MKNRMAMDQDIARVQQMPLGLTRTLSAERLVAEVEAEGPEASLAYAYLVLVESYAHTGQGQKALVPYTAALRLFDSRPDLFDNTDRQMLLWAAKWVVADVMEIPEIPVSRVNALLDDMERRYRLAGAGVDAVAHLRAQWADEQHAADVVDIYEKWVATPRDDFSQCEVCDPGDRAAFLFGFDRQDEAISLIETTLAQGNTCLSEPADMLSRVALAYLDSGRTAEAITAHRRTLAALDNAGATLEGVQARALAFLARAGAAEAVVRRIVEIEPLLLAPGLTPGTQMSTLSWLGRSATAAATVAPELVVASPAAGTLAVGAYGLWCKEQALKIGRRFDLRYGDDHTTRRILDHWDLPVVPLDLGVVGATFSAAEEPNRPQPQGETQEELPQQMLSAAAGPGADVNYLAAAEDAAAQGDLAGAVPNYLQAATDFVQAGELADAGFAYAEAARCAQVLEDHFGAQPLFVRAGELLEAGGVDPALIGPVIRAWAMSATAVGLGAEVLAQLAAAVAQLEVEPTAGEPSHLAAIRHLEAARLLDTQARVLASVGEIAAALEIIGVAADRLAALKADRETAAAAWLAGRLAGQLGQIDVAKERLLAAAAVMSRMREKDERVKVLDDLVQILRSSGNEDQIDAVLSSIGL